MKNKVLVFAFTCFIFQTFAQTFAPVGSKWVYCYAVNAEGGAEGYDTLVVESVVHNPAQSGQSLPVKVNSKLRVKSGHFSGAN